MTDYNPTEAQRLIAEARADRHGWNAIAKIKALADQLEAANAEVERLDRDDARADVNHFANRLAAAQRRIAELEAELRWRTQSHNEEAKYSCDLRSALRAMWLVYRAAEACEVSDHENERGEYVSHETAELNLSRAIDTARAAITPEILAVLKELETK